jgi:hypothetical protein
VAYMSDQSAASGPGPAEVLKEKLTLKMVASAVWTFTDVAASIVDPERAEPGIAFHGGP